MILLRHFYLPQELETEVGRFVDYYNHSSYHESLENVTAADVFFGRQQEILAAREMIKRKMLAGRRRLNLGSFVTV